MSRRIVVGIGNPDRGDDAVGRAVARRLAASLPEDVEIVEHGGEAAGLLECLGGSDFAVLIDAAVSKARPGTVERLDAAARALPQSMFGVSTHGFGLAEAIELARALGKLPRRCVVYAIEARNFEHGAPLSPEVADAVDAAAKRILEELRMPAPA